jgi:hypothetical protein
VSYVGYHGALHEIDPPIDIPANQKTNYRLVGANNRDNTAEELEAIKMNHEPFIKGYLYKEKKLQELIYDPSMLINPDRYFFSYVKETCTNDCLVHSINYALQCPWFINREQVVKLMGYSLRRSLDEMRAKKVEGGA